MKSLKDLDSLESIYKVPEEEPSYSTETPKRGRKTKGLTKATHRLRCMLNDEEFEQFDRYIKEKNLEYAPVASVVKMMIMNGVSSC